MRRIPWRVIPVPLVLRCGDPETIRFRAFGGLKSAVPRGRLKSAYPGTVSGLPRCCTRLLDGAECLQMSQAWNGASAERTLRSCGNPSGWSAERTLVGTERGGCRVALRTVCTYSPLEVQATSDAKLAVHPDDEWTGCS